MKKLMGIGWVMFIGLAACQKPAPPPVDKEAATKAVNELFDQYDKTFNAEDVSGFSATLSDDLLFVGTDPGEFWSKDSLVAAVNRFAKDTTVLLTFSANKRDIRLSEDGATAVVTVQGTFPLVSRKMEVRGVGHARSKDGQWKIDYYSWALIPKNEDVPKLNKAVE